MNEGAVRLEDIGLAVVQRQVLVKELEGVRQRQEGADRDGRHDAGNGDLGQRLPAACAVYPGGFKQVVGHALQAGDVDYHHIAYLLPGHQYEQADKAVFCRKQYGCPVPYEYAVKDHGPDIAQHDAAYEVRHEEHGAEQVRALDAPGKRVGHREGQDVYNNERYHGKKRRVPEGVHEGAVRQRLDIVAEADKLGVGGRPEGAERQIEALCKRVDEAYEKCGKRGQEKDREPLAYAAAEHVAVHREAVPFPLFSFHYPSPLLERGERRLPLAPGMSLLSLSGERLTGSRTGWPSLGRKR